MNSITTYIYIMQCPQTLDVRYVGKTNNPSLRKRSHLWHSLKGRTHCSRWVKNLSDRGFMPIFTVIDQINGEWEWLEIYWIEQFKNWGYNLTNLTKGGEGAYGLGRDKNKPLSAFHLDGRFIKSFESRKQCASFFKTTREHIQNTVNGRNTTLFKKYILRNGLCHKDIEVVTKKKKYPQKSHPHVIRRNQKAVICLNDGNYFKSIYEASKFYGINNQAITNFVLGKTKKMFSGKRFVITDVR